MTVWEHSAAGARQHDEDSTDVGGQGVGSENRSGTVRCGRLWLDGATTASGASTSKLSRRRASSSWVAGMRDGFIEEMSQVDASSKDE
jgi:hypothetical protein